MADIVNDARGRTSQGAKAMIFPFSIATYS